MKKGTVLFPALFLTVQCLAIGILLFAGWQVFQLSDRMVKQDNINTILELTKNYEKSVSELNHNLQKSQDVVPRARKALAGIEKVIDKIGDIKILGKPMIKRSSVIRNSQKAINDSVSALTEYEKETQPSILKSMQETEKALQKLNQQLIKEQHDLQCFPVYVGCMILAFIVLMAFNTVFIMYLYKRQEAA